MSSKVENLLRHLRKFGHHLPKVAGSIPEVQLRHDDLRHGCIGSFTSLNLLNEWQKSFLVMQNGFLPLPNRYDPYVQKHDHNTVSLLEICDFSALISHLRKSRHHYSYDCHQFIKCKSQPGFIRSIEVDTKELKDDARRWIRTDKHLAFDAFCNVEQENYRESFDYFTKQRLMWWKRLCNSPANFSISNPTIVDPNFAESIAEIKFAFPLESTVIETILSHKNLETTRNDFCIEMVTTMEHALLVVLFDAYYEAMDEKDHDEPTVVMKIHPKLSPFKVSILLNDTQSEQQKSLSHRLCQQLRIAGISCHSSNNNDSCDVKDLIKFHDEFGTPYNIIVDDMTVSRGVVAMRNRDTDVKQYHHIEEIKDIIKKMLDYR